MGKLVSNQRRRRRFGPACTIAGLGQQGSARYLLEKVLTERVKLPKGRGTQNKTKLKHIFKFSPAQTHKHKVSPFNQFMG